jgi:hypothetical protein
MSNLNFSFIKQYAHLYALTQPELIQALKEDSNLKRSIKRGLKYDIKVLLKVAIDNNVDNLEDFKQFLDRIKAI